ncbi:hypothetical protein BDV41DRAFT_575891 [Aspergillus transmontanensis]|uniref:NACHT domain-containing protein n=1 Tax=Aspergillus transmontanensis TaxID=1034304 RepID=A0A5N6W0N1_9EURO|nr:hypothetical protein BDV41DRAFT_575891 [Aspergillus transmontanensis]
MTKEMATGHRLSSDDYSVGWVCALPCELEAARRALDQTHHPELQLAENDKNTYTYGEIHGHNVVMTCLPPGGYGTTSAAVAAQQMNASFRSLHYRFMVGIGGGVPSESNDIRLGDIVVSRPEGKDPGVIQYDLGKTLPSGHFEEVGSLNKPPRALLTAIPHMQTDPRFPKRLAATLAAVLTNGELIQSPGYHSDRLFSSSYSHPRSKSTCDECDQQWLVHRKPRPSESPHVHYGLIASGNQVMKDAIERDKLAKSRNILCFEMEAAGLMDDFECLVVRGICDYADSHKNKTWQPYAAATAAAYVKILLEVVHRRQGKQTLEKHLQIPPELDKELCRLFVTDPNENRRSLMARRGRPTENTCQWIFKTDALAKWLDARAAGNRPADSILWLHGLPGSGKSTMAMCLTEGLEQHFDDHQQDSFAYFFCEANHDTQNTATSILRGILWQLIRQNPILGDCLSRRFRERKDTLLTSFDALWTLFTEIVIDPRCGVSFCIIDALDECDFESLMLILKQLKLSFFDRPSSQFTSNVRILITSRPYKEIETYLSIFPSRDLASFQEGRKDIEIFIEQKVSHLNMCKSYPDGMRSSIRNILKEKAAGTFLWVGLTCNELMDVDIQDTMSFLGSLAPGLNTLYTKLMEKAVESEQKRERVYSILAVVAVSRQALTLFQLCMACSLYVGEEDTRVVFAREDIKLCRLMVVEKDGLVNLLHKSVQDFLFRSDLTHFPTIEESHAQLAYSCINYAAKHFQKPFRGLGKLLDDREYRLAERRDVRDLNDQIDREISGWDEYIPYCSQYWMEHAHLAGPIFDVKKITETHFLTLDSSSREGWLRYYRLNAYRIPEKLGILHIAAKWGIPQLINFTLSKEWANGSNFYVDTEFLTSDYTTPLEEAAKSGNMGALSILVSRSNPATLITSSVLTAVFRHNANRADFIASLLKDMGHRIVVTEELEIAAAQNDGEGPEILRLLLAHRDRKLHISEPHISMPVLVAAARNQGKGRQIMEHLFKYLNNEIPVTEKLLRVAAENTKCANALLEMLLDHWKGDDIPECVVAAAAGNWGEGPLLIRLLQMRANKAIQITDSILSSAFNNLETGIKCLEQLWKESSQPTIVGEQAIEYSHAGHELVLCWALSQPCDRIMFSKDATRAIFATRSVTVIEKVLARCEEGQKLPEDLPVAAAGNEYYGASIFMFLFLSYSQQVEVTDRMVARAVCSKEMLEVILAHRPADQDVVSEEALVNATKMASNQSLDLMGALLKAKTGSIHIDKKFKYELFRDGAIMDLILDHPKVTACMDSTVIDKLDRLDKNDYLMGRFLTLPEERVTFSQEAVEAIVQKYGRKNIELLLHHKNIPIRGWTVEHIIQHHDADILSLLLDGRCIRMTREIEYAASLNIHGPRTLAVLIQGTEGDLSSNERLLKAVVSECEPHIIQQYFQRLPSDTWTRKTISTLVSCQNKSRSTQSLVQLLLQSHQDMWIDRQVVEEIAESCHASIIETALQRSDLSKDDILMAALNNVNYGSGAFSLLVGDGKPRFVIDTEFIYGIARVSDPETMAHIIQKSCDAQCNLSMPLLLWAAAENRSSGYGVIQSLLNTNAASLGVNDLVNPRSLSRCSKPHKRPLPITQTIMDAISQNQELWHKIVRIFLGASPDKVCLTGSGLRGIIKNFDIEFIQDVLSGRNLHADIDHLMIEAGVGNRLDGPRVLELLLSRVTTQVEITGQTVVIALGNASHRKALMCQLIRSEKTLFGQAAIREVMKSMDSTIITDLILSRGRSPQVDEMCVLEVIAAQHDSSPHIVAFFQLLDRLNQPVTLTSSIIRKIWLCNGELQVINEVLNSINNGGSVTATAMVEFIHLYSKSLQSWSPSFSEQLDQWCDILAAYRGQLGDQGAIDEEVLVALLYANEDDRYFRRISAQRLHFSLPVIEDLTAPIGRQDCLSIDYDEISLMILGLLFDAHPPVAITTGGVMCILKEASQEVALLIVQLPRQRFRICPEIATKLAAVANEKAMAIIFDQCDECIKVTEDMLLAAAGNLCNGVINYLLGLSPTSFTREVIIRVLEEGSPDSMDILRSHLRYCLSEIDITEDLLMAVVENMNSKKWDLMKLFETNSAPSCFQNHISEAILIKAATGLSGGEIMRGLLEISVPLPITEEVLVLASQRVDSQFDLLRPMTERDIIDLLTKKRIDRTPPSIEFLETAFSIFKPSVLAHMIDLYKGLIVINSQLVSYSLGRTDFHEIRNVLTARGLVSAVDGKSTICTRSHKSAHQYKQAGSKSSIPEKSHTFFDDISLTEEMVHDGQADLIQSCLSQQTRTVIVAPEAIPAVFKYHGLTTIKILLSGKDNIVIPSMLMSSLQSMRVEDMKRGSFRPNLRIDVTDDIICAAIENSSDQNLAILRFLFIRFGCPTIMSNKVLVAAASAHHNSTEILELLLCCNQGEIDELEPIAVAAAANQAHGDHLLAILFDHFGDEIQPSEYLLVAAVENQGTKHVLLQCVPRSNCQVTPNVLAAAARNPIFAVEMMKMLLEKFQTPITETVLIEAACNEDQSDRLLDLFLEQRRSEVQLTEKIIKGFLGRTRYYHELTGHYRVPETILDPSFYVDPHSVQIAAILSRSLSYSQFDIFLSKYQPVNPQDLAVELAQQCHDVTLRMFLKRYGSDVCLSEDLLKKAARNTHWRTNILAVFIFCGERLGQAVAVTPDLVAAAAENPKYGYDSVQLLRTRHSAALFVNSEALLAAVSNQAGFSLRLLRLLFRCSQEALPITTELLSAAAKNSAHGTEMLRLLLSRLHREGDNQVVFEDVLKGAAANTTVTGSLQDSNYFWNSPLGLLIRNKRDRIQITEGALVTAAANPQKGKNCVLLLLKYAEGRPTITENILSAAARNEEQGYDILIALLNHPAYQKVAISEKVLAAGLGNDRYDNWDKIVKLLLSHHGAPVPVSERMILAALESDHESERKMKMLLQQYQGPISISDNTLQEVSRRLGDSICRKLRARQIHSNAPERTKWHVVWRLFILFVSCYIWPFFLRDSK